MCITLDRRIAELASQHLSNRLETVGITTHLRLWADGERWREFTTGATGLQTQETAERIAATTVFTGTVQPAASRASLAASLVGHPSRLMRMHCRVRENRCACSATP